MNLFLYSKKIDGKRENTERERIITYQGKPLVLPGALLSVI